jgi:N-acetylmuramic acid 6-phosphate etherase
MINLDKIATEQRNSKTMKIDEANSLEIVKMINDEDRTIADSIAKQAENIAKVIDEGTKAYNSGGRIIYLGAGTSGRLGILDAVECPPTYGTSLDEIVGIIAGGEKAFIQAVEGAEDSKELAVADLAQINFNEKDFLIGIAASGRTPYVIGGIEYAKNLGAKTAGIAMSADSEVGSVADYKIEAVTGPEVVTGSTRMKAGTGQKMILNMISTGIMIQSGKVYQNLMVDVKQTNEKLVKRAQRIVMQATNCNEETAIEKLHISDGNAKLAIVMILFGLDINQAKEKLTEAKGKIKNIK